LTYTAREVAELVGLSIPQVRRFARAGLLSPRRTPQNHYRFSFQDLTVLRTTTRLFETDLPRHRVHRALRRLRRQHPRERPLSEVRLTVTGNGIRAHDGVSVWNPESGQIYLDFAGPGTTTHISIDPLQHTDQQKEPFETIDSWFERGCALEAQRPGEARQAYRRVLALNPSYHDARVNLARLLHAIGQTAEAIEHYGIVLTAAPDHTTAAYNLGITLEDEGQHREAFIAYAQALAVDPDYAEAHFNIAKLYEQAGDELAAVRHLRTYKQLTQN
jgi:tetratricopeptide (TPR) repeat protein